MKFTIFFLAIIAITLSCQNSPDENQKEEEKNQTAIVFGNIDYSFPQLSPTVNDQVLHWDGLEDFFMEIKKLNGANFQEIGNRSERLVGNIDMLFKNIPDTMNINQIKSRLLVVQTRGELLYQVAHRGSIDSADLQNSVMEMNNAVKNFIIHLNEKFNKDIIDSQRKENEKNELKNQKSFSDSIMELERQDIQNRKV